MNLNQLCKGKAEAIWIHLPKDKQFNIIGILPNSHIVHSKRIRMKCELCGRKVLSSLSLYHDGDYIIHSIPPHKPKGWWKKRIKLK